MMGKITVGKLKEQLKEIIETLDDYEDDCKIMLEPNIYFLGACHSYLGLSGYNGGYLSLDNIEESIITEE